MMPSARDVVLHPAFAVELLEPREMAEADRLAATTTRSLDLMERAGEAVAAAALRLLGDSTTRRVLALCGPGNNGGDAYVAARRLRDAGCITTLVSLVPRTALRGDAAAAAARWGSNAAILDQSAFADQDLVIDGLFGAGLARDIAGDARHAVELTNEWRAATGGRVLAIDIPSGIDGRTGAVRGIAISADASVTFFRLKPGHVLMPGRLHCGSLALADIGIDASVLETIAPRTVLNAPAVWRVVLPKPTLTGHKYARGHAVVVSGPIAQTGAARLCARGALRAGAGLVTVATPTDALPIHAAALTAIMTRVADDATALGAILADPRKNAVAMGPGLGIGEGTRAFVHTALCRPFLSDGPPMSLVLDADALTSFAEHPDDLFAAIKASGQDVVLTPHDGEFAKLFGQVVDVGAAKPERARAAAKASGATIVLKGPDTVVAHPDGRASIAMSEAPWLATAGSGDVLAGMIAGLLAQGMPPFDASCAAVWMHAEAARRFGPGLISEDIPEMLPTVFRQLFALERPSDWAG